MTAEQWIAVAAGVCMAAGASLVAVVPRAWGFLVRLGAAWRSYMPEDEAELRASLDRLEERLRRAVKQADDADRERIDAERMAEHWCTLHTEEQQARQIAERELDELRGKGCTDEHHATLGRQVAHLERAVESMKVRDRRLKETEAKLARMRHDADAFASQANDLGRALNERNSKVRGLEAQLAEAKKAGGEVAELRIRARDAEAELAMVHSDLERAGWLNPKEARELVDGAAQAAEIANLHRADRDRARKGCKRLRQERDAARDAALEIKAANDRLAEAAVRRGVPVGEVLDGSPKVPIMPHPWSGEVERDGFGRPRFRPDPPPPSTQRERYEEELDKLRARVAEAERQAREKDLAWIESERARKAAEDELGERRPSYKARVLMMPPGAASAFWNTNGLLEIRDGQGHLLNRSQLT